MNSVKFKDAHLKPSEMLNAFGQSNEMFFDTPPKTTLDIKVLDGRVQVITNLCQDFKFILPPKYEDFQDAEHMFETFGQRDTLEGFVYACIKLNSEKRGTLYYKGKRVGMGRGCTVNITGYTTPGGYESILPPLNSTVVFRCGGSDYMLKHF